MAWEAKAVVNSADEANCKDTMVKRSRVRSEVKDIKSVSFHSVKI